MIEHLKGPLPVNLTVDTLSDFELKSKNGGEQLNIFLPPNPQDAHMMISINETFSMVIGGIAEQSWNITAPNKTSLDLIKDSLTKERDPTTNLFYYDHNSQKWTPGPELMHPRHIGSIAGILIDKVTGEEIISVYTDGAKYFDWSILGCMTELNVNQTNKKTIEFQANFWRKVPKIGFLVCITYIFVFGLNM